MAEDKQKVSHKTTYDEIDKGRGAVIDRALLCSELTIPYIFREDTATDSDDLTREYVQGFGAKLVNHLTGKFALSILPPSQPFYRLSPSNEALEVLSQGNEQAIQEIEKMLSVKEDGIMRYINKSNFRKALYPAIKLSMVTGDSLIEKTDEDTYRVFNMNNYVIKRDSSGNVILLVIKETLDYDAVPEDIKGGIDEKEKDKPVELYTKVELVEGSHVLTQQINEADVGTEITLKKFNDRFILVPFNLVQGENHGRGLVEEYLGTFLSLNKNLKVVDESSAIGAKTVFTLNPNGSTKKKDFLNAKNGEVIVGNETDIGVVRVQKGNDLQQIYSRIEEAKRELSEAFLMSSASIRDAERVTAKEIQLIATELESSFGGVYTAIASGIQLPLVENAMATLKLDGGDDVDVIITAGVEALGRNVELNKLNGMIQELTLLGQLVGQESVAQYINVGSIANSIVANSGVASKNYIKGQGEVEQQMKASKEDAIAEQVIAGGGQQLGQNMANEAIQQ